MNNIIHQTTNSIGEDIYNAFLYRDIYYAAHFHRGYEFVYVVSGEVRSIIDGKVIRIKKGQSLLLSPYQIHSYDESENSVTFVAVFSETHVPYYFSLTGSKKAVDPIFTLSEKVKDFALSVIMPTEEIKDAVLQLDTPDMLSLKGALYAVCSDYFKQADFYDVAETENSILLECLRYIEENYSSDISLKTMAKAVGYNQEYLSRIFNKGLGVHFKTMLHQYRIEKACQIITDTNQSMSTIALECGFQSIRTFNRVFIGITKQTPSSLRSR